MVSATTLLLKLETGSNLKALQIEDPHLWLIDKHILESSMLSTKSKLSIHYLLSFPLWNLQYDWIPAVYQFIH